MVKASSLVLVGEKINFVVVIIIPNKFLRFIVWSFKIVFHFKLASLFSCVLFVYSVGNC